MTFGPKSDGDGGLRERTVPIDYVTALPLAGDFVGHLFVLTTGAVGLYVWDGASFVGPLGVGGGGGAPTTATYVTLSLDGTLTSERVLTAGAAIGIVDGGANGNVTVQVSDNGVSDAKLRQSAAHSVIGRAANSVGNVADIVAPGLTDFCLREFANTIGFGQLDTNGIADFAVETAKLDNQAVSNAKLVDMASATIKGRQNIGAGQPQDLTAAQARAILNVADGANNYVHPNHSGDVTSVGDGAQTIAADAVTYAKMQNVSAASKLLGRGSAAGAGDPQEITLGTNLSMSGTTLNASGSGTTPTGTGFRHVTAGVEDAAAKLVDTADVNDDQITNAKLADMAQKTIKGRAAAAGTGNPTDLSVAEVDTIMGVSTTVNVNGIPRANGVGLPIGWIIPHSAVAMLCTDSSNTVAWRFPNASNGSCIAWIKDAGDNFTFPRVAINGSFPGGPGLGQFCWRPDLGSKFIYDSTLAGWLGEEVFAFHFSVLVDWSTTGYLVWDAGGSAPAFADRLGPIFPFQTKVIGMALAMDASGTASVQVTGAGTAVGGTGDTLALSSQTKKSQYGVYSSNIAADTVLGVKLISGTIQGPAAGTVWLRRFET